MPRPGPPAAVAGRGAGLTPRGRAVRGEVRHGHGAENAGRGVVMLAAGQLSVVALRALRLNHGMADVRGGNTAPTYRIGPDR